jgi:predicted polyphosphate/ATP-dependent NAD kinase
MKVGFLINPLAGIGGAVALKGSDGEEIVARAISLGGQSQAQSRAALALSKISVGIGTGQNLTFYTAAGAMGEAVLRELEMSFEVIYTAANLSTSSTAGDTKNLVRLFIEKAVDLIVFTGGDGTARDVLDVLSCENDSVIPVIGIPAGVKMHSAVYATTPTFAGELMQLIISGEPMSLVEAQVMDLDEDLFRQGKVNAKCYGYLSVPVDDTRMQLIKQGGLNHQELSVQDIAEELIENMKDDVVYLIGSGSTTAEVMNQLTLTNTLLGIDIVCNKQLLSNDADEKTILEKIKDKTAKIVVTIIGGQGHVFGRGNQQLSASVIRQVGVDNIIIIATNEKLRSLNKRPMISDTGDDQLDKELSGLYAVVTGYQQKTLYRLN